MNTPSSNPELNAVLLTRHEEISPGVFVVGSASGPKPLQDTLAQGHVVAERASALVDRRQGVRGAAGAVAVVEAFDAAAAAVTELAASTVTVAEALDAFQAAGDAAG